MENYRYVVIDENGKILQDKYLNGKIQESEFEFEVPLDIDLSNKRYINGQWEDYFEKYEDSLPLLPKEENPIGNLDAVFIQLDSIEAKIDKSQQDIIDEYTLELLETGVL